MRYSDLVHAFRLSPVVSLDEIRAMDAHFHRRRLNDWQKKGYLQKIVKGHYLFTGRTPDFATRCHIANRIYPLSYVSFQTALLHYGLIPAVSEVMIVSAASRRTYTFETQVGQFHNHHLKADIMFGYETTTINGISFSMANLEKALLDYLYINSNIIKKEHFRELNINPDVFYHHLDLKRLQEYLMKFQSPTLTRRTIRLIRFMAKHTQNTERQNSPTSGEF